MKKIILATLIGFIFSTNAKASTGTTIISPATGTATVTTSSQWTGTTTPTIGGTWTRTGAGAPYTFSIQAGFTIIISGTTTASLTVASTILKIDGQVGFASGDNNILMAPTGTISFGANGKLGFGTGANYRGNSTANVVIGSNNQSGPFLVTVSSGTITQSTKFTTTWTGGHNNNNWNDDLNWNGLKPTAEKNVIIPGGLTYYPIISGNFSALKVKVLAGGTFTIDAAANLTVNDSLINNGSIYIASTGNLQQTTTSPLSGSGTFQVDLDAPGANSYVSSPIHNASVTGHGFTPTGTDGAQLIPKSTCDPSALDPTSPYGNLLELHENANILSNCTQSMWFVKSAGTLTDGRGYSLAGPVSLTFTGTVNNGTVSYTGLTRQANNASLVNDDGSHPGTGWHLVGNPYPSAIVLSAATLTVMGFDAQIQRWNNGSWESFNPLSTVTLAAGQGFQIRKSAVGGSSNFTLDNSFRGNDNSDYLRQSTLQQNLLNITLGNDSLSDKTMVYFYNGATDGFDPQYDANRLSDALNRPMIYSIVDNERLSYNALPFMNPGEIKTDTLGIRTHVNGSYTLTITDVSTLGVNVFLKDLKLNTEQKVTDNFVYNFNTQSGDNNKRFALRLDASASNLGTGISSVKNSTVNLFPNPTSGTTTLVLSADNGFSKIAITDIFGNTLQTYELGANETKKVLSTDLLSNGVYFIKLTGVNAQEVIKLIKQ